MLELILLFCSFQQTNTVPLKSYYVTEFPSKQSESVDYVIITGNELVSEYEVLKEWKTSKGVNCMIKTVDWITQNYPGCDVPDKIRNFIKSAYSDWNTRWVLLGGDPKIVPTRLAASKTGGYSPYYLIASDLYYSALNGTWNADGDALWGEAIVDSVDFTPFVYVGRLPGSNIEESKKIINKIIEYEKNPFIDCLERALFLTFKEETNGVRAVMKYFPDYFTIDTLWDGSKSKILEYMAKGYGFVYGAFHGSSSQYWSRGGGNISRMDIDNLNTTLYSINAISCHTHQIELDCLSRRCMLNPSISCLGSSRVGWFSTETSVNSLYYVAVFDSLFPAGKALSYVKYKLISQSQTDGECRDVMLGYDLYGDPELRFWTRKPGKLQVVHPLSIMPGEKEIKVVVRGDNIPVTEAAICIYREGESYGRGYTDSNGELVFSIVAETRGELKIVVTKADFLPYEGYIFVQPEHAYLKYKNYDVTGNAEPGQDITLSISIENTGAVKTFDVFAKLKNFSPYLTVVDTLVQYGNILPGEIISQNYNIKINNICPDTNIDFELFIYNAADSSKDTFNLPVFAPMLSHYSHYVDSAGYLSIKVKNSGRGSAKCVNAMILTLTAGVFISDPVEKLGNLGCGITSFDNAFRFNTSVSNPSLALRFEDSLSNVWADTFIYKTINPPSGLYTEAKSSGILVGWAPVSGAYAYNVYRMPDSLLVNSYPVKDVYSYEDKQVTPFTGYSYCVTSLDNSLNESDFSQPVFGRSNPALKPGWPKRGKSPFVNSPVTADIFPNIPGLEIVINSGDGPQDEDLYAWYANGEGILSENGVFASNLGAAWSTPVIADINGDNSLELIRSESWVSKPRIWAFNKGGSVLPGFPIQPGSFEIVVTFSSPSVYDLDNDGKLEIIFPEQEKNTGKIYVFRCDGSGFLNPDGLFAEQESLSLGVAPAAASSSPAVADINGDGTPEIVFGFTNTSGDTARPSLCAWDLSGMPLPGWPVLIRGIPTSPVIGDIDTMYPGLEVIVYTTGSLVYAFHSDGTYVDNWPKSCITSDWSLISKPALGDIDDDGIPEIAVSGVNNFYLWKGNGNVVPGWPVTIPSMNMMSPASPILADVDGDDEIEYIGVTLIDGTIYAFEPDGKKVPGFPITANGRTDATPLIADIDADGHNELVSANMDFLINVWQVKGNKIEWGGFGHDRWHTGTHGFVPYDTILTGTEENTNSKLKIAELRTMPNPFINSTVINYVVPFNSLSSETKTSLKIYDASGRFVKTLVNQNLKPGKYTVKWKAVDNNGKQVAAGIYFCKLETNNSPKIQKLILLK